MFKHTPSKEYLNGWNETPKSRYYNLKENGVNGATLRDRDTAGETPVFSEKKLAACGLILSLFVVAGKILSTYGSNIEELLLEQKLVTYKILTEDGNEMFMYSWKTFIKYSNIWVPAICGFLSSYFTWMMVYLDSNVPGVQPPSPFSPKKYQVQSGHTFHLNYVFALVVGVFVFFYMYFKNISIHY